MRRGEALLMARHAALKSLLLKADIPLAPDCCRPAAVAAAPAGRNARKPEMCMEDSPEATALCQMCQVMQGSHKAFFELLGVADWACGKLRCNCRTASTTASRAAAAAAAKAA